MNMLVICLQVEVQRNALEWGIYVPTFVSPLDVV